ncbi:Pr6Pr family membrane protein [Microbacterium sp. NPDC056234]|uniref:Pr6Pr family membrane protein n=1 Tax=Microbacterium sp. NPDC056234 TaxID=3345757 RepID=UPI0035D822D1
MRWRTIFGALRLLTAAVCLGALTHRLFWGLSSNTVAGDNFFAYLTVQSNCALVALLAVGGVLALRRENDPRWFTIALALVLTWTITAGLAFALIVWQAGLRGIRIDVPWSDQLLHFWLPACTALAWGITPGHRRVTWLVVPGSLAFPILWGLVTLWRGPSIGWYPYYFLDPRQVSGPLEFVVTCALALAIFALVATAVVGVSRMPSPWAPLARRRSVKEPVRYGSSSEGMNGANDTSAATTAS